MEFESGIRREWKATCKTCRNARRDNPTTSASMPAMFTRGREFDRLGQEYQYQKLQEIEEILKKLLAIAEEDFRLKYGTSPDEYAPGTTLAAADSTTNSLLPQASSSELVLPKKEKERDIERDIERDMIKNDKKINS